MLTYTYKNLIKSRAISIIIVILFFVIHFGDNAANAEYFTSVDSLHKLVEAEMELVEGFRSYLEMQRQELQSYQKFIENIRLQHTIANEGYEDYLGNPISSLALMKRMVYDWGNLHGFLRESQSRTAFSEFMQEFKEKNKISADYELNGAAMGLGRLQKVYNLTARDLSNGQIKDVYTGTELTWHDCFEIATSLFVQKETLLAVEWFELTLEGLSENSDSQKAASSRRFELEALEYLALSHYELGNSDAAVKLIDEILTLDPGHYTKDMRVFIANSPPKQPKVSGLTYSQNYTRLCQGIQVPQKELRNLKCVVETRGNPRFIIAPLKIEPLSKDPEINLYHGLLTDKQIQQIIEEAENKMFRSMIGNATYRGTSDERISQQAWLQYRSPVMSLVYYLVGDVIGMDLANCEQFQMANYGIGGQYDAHFDFISPTHTFVHWLGSRFTTNMFYLSDVEQGGFTVFPHINVYARPVKGAMISWFNLHSSLDPDLRALHAGCPVLTGSKRIGNIWVHSGLQELRRPCSLERDAYKSEAFKDVAIPYYK